jgi:hypothetical protein
MSQNKPDLALPKLLDWGIARMKSAGYEIQSKVILDADSKLQIMGYAKREAGVHHVIIAEWALDSEMLGGLVLHELSHIYHTEVGSPSHSQELLEDVLSRLQDSEGLSERERNLLVEAYNHLQNIVVDDIVFKVLSQKELSLTEDFFAGWISNQATGDRIYDTSLIVRNAFAIASLKRRALYSSDGDIQIKNSELLSSFDQLNPSEFEAIETLLQEAGAEMTSPEFRSTLTSYFDKVLSLARERRNLADLR